jgi:hypothetical protein
VTNSFAAPDQPEIGIDLAKFPLRGAQYMKTIAALAITVVCLSFPAFPETDEERSKRSSNNCLQTNSCRYEPHGEIEKKYYEEGPWRDVTVRETDGPCDSAGNKCLLVYPTNLGTNGFKHPIVAYGNGTNADPIEAAYFLKHLASWGFVIAGSEDKQTLPGITILDSVKFLIAADSNTSRIFLNKLDVSQIGAVGYSQGAFGVISAMIKSPGLIKTIIPIELPAKSWCNPACPDPDVRNLTQGSIFFVTGSADPISPATQPPGSTSEQSIEAYYDAVPDNLMKVRGTLIGPSHNDISGQPDCGAATGSGCVVGVYGYLGYPTAWLMYHLRGDDYARGAFVEETGEIFNRPAVPALREWDHVASNIH